MVRSSAIGATLVVGLIFTALGWGGSALTYSVPLFVAMLVPGAIGIGLCNATLIALVSNAASRREQGRIQGAAGALESLGRTLGPVWGNVRPAEGRRRRRLRRRRRPAPGRRRARRETADRHGTFRRRTESSA